MDCIFVSDECCRQFEGLVVLGEDEGSCLCISGASHLHGQVSRHTRSIFRMGWEQGVYISDHEVSRCRAHLIPSLSVWYDCRHNMYGVLRFMFCTVSTVGECEPGGGRRGRQIG